MLLKMQMQLQKQLAALSEVRADRFACVAPSRPDGITGRLYALTERWKRIAEEDEMDSDNSNESKRARHAEEDFYTLDEFVQKCNTFVDSLDVKAAARTAGCHVGSETDTRSGNDDGHGTDGDSYDSIGNSSGDSDDSSGDSDDSSEDSSGDSDDSSNDISSDSDDSSDDSSGVSSGDSSGDDSDDDSSDNNSD